MLGFESIDVIYLKSALSHLTVDINGQAEQQKYIAPEEAIRPNTIEDENNEIY